MLSLADASELLDILKGTQISETLSPKMRKLLYKERKIKDSDKDISLEDSLVAAIMNGRNLVVTGSAGGGKTMLIEHIIGKVRQLKPDISLFVVNDLTAITEDRRSYLRENISKYNQYIIAANEGILRLKEVRELLDGAWETLRLLQNGENSKNPEKCIVVDIAGFDPITSALAGILSDENIHAAVKLHEENCSLNSPNNACPRIEALNLLDFKMASEVVEIVKAVFGSSEVTYRELWNFVIDLFFGGECNSSIPTSAWFWRLFRGKNSISTKLNIHHKPNILSMPEVTPFLYRGDWQKVIGLYFNNNYNFVDPGSAPILERESTYEFDLLFWLKIQTALVARASDIEHPLFVGEIASNLEKQVIVENRIDLLVEALNGYFTRSASEVNQNSLNLWIDLATEKKSKRSRSLIGIGSYPKRDLEIIKSKIVGNLDGVEVLGSRVYLRSKNNSSSRMELSSYFFDALIQGRPISTERRQFDDVDHAIKKFYLEIFNSHEVEDQLILKLLTSNDSEQVFENKFRITKNKSVEYIF